MSGFLDKAGQKQIRRSELIVSKNKLAPKKTPECAREALERIQVSRQSGAKRGIAPIFFGFYVPVFKIGRRTLENDMHFDPCLASKTILAPITP
jgi:hypothetical protein